MGGRGLRGMIDGVAEAQSIQVSASIGRVDVPSKAENSRRRDVHDPALDGLRGLAILGVVLNHSTFQIARPPGGVHALVYNWVQSGWLGVDAFFVLSGFLITGILVDARGDGARPRDRYFSAFYARRVLRIFPLYYLFLVGALLVWRVPTPRGAWGYWTYLANIMFVAAGPAPLSLAQLWSLPVEEQFYVVWPLAIAWTARRLRVPLCLAIILVSWVLTVAMTRAGEHTAAYLLTPTRAYALALGAFAALALRDPSLRRAVESWAKWVGLTAAAGLAVILSTPAFMNGTGWWSVDLESPLAAVLTASCIVAIMSGRRQLPLRRVLAWPPLVSCGVYSYAMYLLHMPVAIGVGMAVHSVWPSGVRAGSLLVVGSVVLLTWAVGWLSRRLVEQPFLSLKRFVPMPGSGLGAVPIL
jgi:peptidoglycan/LPS O-acetylase OafA/YrhL